MPDIHLPGWLRRIAARLRHRRFDRDLHDEIAAHEAMIRDALEANGVSSDEARAQARRQLGNPTRAREDARAVWIPALVDSVRADLRYALRGLGRSPAYTLTALATLVVAIGLNSSLFTVFNALYLRPWPVPDSRSLFAITLVPRPGLPDDGMPGLTSLPYRDFLAMRGLLTRSALAALGEGPATMSLRYGTTVDSAPVLAVSSDFFTVVRPPVHIGRGLASADAATPAAVIAHNFWTSRFGGDATVIGRPIFINGVATTIAGVLGPAFKGIPPRPVDIYVLLPESGVWSPAWRQALGNYDTGDSRAPVRVVGRLVPGWSQDEAALKLAAVHTQVSTDRRRASRDVLLTGTAHGQRPGAMPSDTATTFQLLFAGGLLVLLLACANVGNLQLARDLARRREIATRLALGAGRARVVRQLLSEATVLSLIAGAGAVVIAWILPNAVMAVIAPRSAALELTPDLMVLGFSLVLCLGVTVAFGLTPALQITKGRPLSVHLHGRTSTAQARRLRTLILGLQVAVSTVLIVCAALLARGLYVHVQRDLGFAEGVLVASVSQARGRQLGEARTRGVVSALEQAGAEDLAISFPRVLAGGYRTEEITLAAGERPLDVIYFGVSPNFFRVLDIPFVGGRTFSGAPGRDVVVNETLARRVAPDGAAIGRTLLAESGPYRVIGVVADRQLLGGDTPRPLFFRPYVPGRIQPDILLRDDGTPDARGRVSAIVTSIDPDLSVRVAPLEERIADHIRDSVIGTSLAWAMGVIALGLATVGVFGVFGYIVEERRREVGIRLALGSGRGRVVLSVIRSTRWALAGGLALGVLIATAGGSTLQSFLYGLDPIDPLSYAIAGGILLTVALIATAIPARRAASVDPAVTLRSE